MPQKSAVRDATHCPMYNLNADCIVLDLACKHTATVCVCFWNHTLSVFFRAWTGLRYSTHHNCTEVHEKHFFKKICCGNQNQKI